MEVNEIGNIRYGSVYGDSIHLLVLPAASKPSIRIRISLLPKIFDNSFPMMMCHPLNAGQTVN